jgi:hypothetical protein
MATVLAIYGAVLSTALAIARLVGWSSTTRRRLTVRMFISPLVVDADGHVRVQNEQGHPVVQNGSAREVVVVRAYNPGRRAVQVARVELLGPQGTPPENLSWLALPRTIQPDDVQLWYSTFERYPADVNARVTLTNGRAFESPRYRQLLAYMNPLDPIAGR